MTYYRANRQTECVEVNLNWRTNMSKFQQCWKLKLQCRIQQGSLTRGTPVCIMRPAATIVNYVKAVPLQAWSGPAGSRKLRFPDFMTTAEDGGKVVSLTHRPPLPPGNTPGTHFC